MVIDVIEGRLIRTVRAKLEEIGKSQKWLVQQDIGLSETTLSKAMTGQTRLSAGTWRKICEKVGVDYNETTTVKNIPRGQEMELWLATDDLGQKRFVGSPKAAYEQGCWGTTVQCSKEGLRKLADYAEAQLTVHLKGGVNMTAEEMYTLLDAWHAIKEAAKEEPETEPPEEGPEAEECGNV